MNDHLISNRDVTDFRAYRPNDTRTIAATGVKVFRFALFLTIGDDIDGIAQCRPDVVVVDAGGHGVNQYILRPNLRNRYDLALPGIFGFTKPILADTECVHVFRHNTERRFLSEFINLLGLGCIRSAF